MAESHPAPTSELTTPAYLHLPAGSELVEDASDEVNRAWVIPDKSVLTNKYGQIFWLYTRKQAGAGSLSTETSTSALGYLDAKTDLLSVSITICEAHDNWNDHTRKTAKQARGKTPSERTIEAEIHQDLNALRNRKGDTGSVVWRTSIRFAEYLLKSHSEAPTASKSSLGLLATPSDLSVLELGSGTGGLGILVSHLFEQWTFTDQYDNLALISRNLRHNGLLSVASPPPRAVSTPKSQHKRLPALEPQTSQRQTSYLAVEELDWVAESAAWTAALQRRNSDATSSHAGPLRSERRATGQDRPAPSVIFAVDCLYNSSLSPCLAHTIDRQAGQDTVVVLVSELRDPEPLEVFLDAWLQIGRQKVEDRGTWRIARVDFGSEWADGIGARDMVVWVGWKGTVDP